MNSQKFWIQIIVSGHFYGLNALLSSCRHHRLVTAHHDALHMSLGSRPLGSVSQSAHAGGTRSLSTLKYSFRSSSVSWSFQRPFVPGGPRPRWKISHGHPHRARKGNQTPGGGEAGCGPSPVLTHAVRAVRPGIFPHAYFFHTRTFVDEGCSAPLPNSASEWRDVVGVLLHVVKAAPLTCSHRVCHRPRTAVQPARSNLTPRALEGRETVPEPQQRAPAHVPCSGMPRGGATYTCPQTWTRRWARPDAWQPCGWCPADPGACQRSAATERWEACGTPTWHMQAACAAAAPRPVRGQGATQ